MIKPKKSLDEIMPERTDYYKTDWRLKLDLNENVWGVSDLVFNTLKSLSKEDISRYPNESKLIEKLADKYEIKPDNIILTSGLDETIRLIMEAYIEKDDEILSYNPINSACLAYLKICGAKICIIEYDEKFVFDKEKIIENLNKKTKIIYISTPDNFTGNIVRPCVIEFLAQKAQDTLIIVDCNYINFAQNAVFEDYIDIVKKFDNVILMKSFSQDYSLAGLGVAFAVSNQDVIQNVKKLAPFYNVNTAAIHCAISAMNEEKRPAQIKELNFAAKEALFNGLKGLGYTPYPSEGNFILCDFGQYCDFYYEKLKINGVIVQKFSKTSNISSCLRITIPKLSGVKYILELLKTKDVLIFDVDGVIFDVSDSYINAIKETFKHFTNKTAEKSEIQKIKNEGGANYGWDVVKRLLEKHEYDVGITDIIRVFQDLFFNPYDAAKDKKYLIDEEKLLISHEIFDKLIQKYDLVIFSDRFRDEINYSFNKFGLNKYFCYYVTSDDLPKNMLKPNSKGVFKILKHCPHKSIKYIGDSVDDIIAGNGANVKTIGVVSPDSEFGVMVNNFKHLGAAYILDDIKRIIAFLDEFV